MLNKESLTDTRYMCIQVGLIMHVRECMHDMIKYKCVHYTYIYTLELLSITASSQFNSVSVYLQLFNLQATVRTPPTLAV